MILQDCLAKICQGDALAVNDEWEKLVGTISATMTTKKGAEIDFICRQVSAEVSAKVAHEIFFWWGLLSVIKSLASTDLFPFSNFPIFLRSPASFTLLCKKNLRSVWYRCTSVERVMSGAEWSLPDVARGEESTAGSGDRRLEGAGVTTVVMGER